MQASVVISYYKNIANLEILLLALKNQSSKNTFEVIISEDDDALETKNFINQQQHLLQIASHGCRLLRGL
jgi:glycosyltransferase involved in cell wall biosynthesis